MKQLAVKMALVMFGACAVQAGVISYNLYNTSASPEEGDVITGNETFGIASFGTVVSNWNNGGGTDADLVWDDGSTSSVGIVGDGLTAPARFNTAYVNTPLRSGYGGFETTVRSLTLTNLTENFSGGYYVIAYVGGYNATTNASVSDGTTTYYYSVDPTGSSTFIQTTDTNLADGGSTAQYAVFGSVENPLTADTLQISVSTSGDTSARSGLCGLQIIAVPEPTSLGLFTIVGGMIFALRHVL
jgi:hypothetical protein